jgi:D-alanyl-lipoteichoic acid acyltransferase DltB (MBOAT superfamily)
MGAAFGMALVLAILVLAEEGTDAEAIKQALRATARWSFLFFWMAYAGGALAALFGPTFRALAVRGRQFGLAFASAHLVHAGLVLWLYQISLDPPVKTRTLVFFAVGLFWTYLLALLSIPTLSGLLPPKILRIVRTLGMEYIALAFLVDFRKNPFEGSALHALAYLPFLALCAIGPILRLAAFVRRRRARDRTHTPMVLDVAAAPGLESGAYSGRAPRR